MADTYQDGSSPQALHVRAAAALQAQGRPVNADNLNRMMGVLANAQGSGASDESASAMDAQLNALAAAPTPKSTTPVPTAANQPAPAAKDAPSTGAGAAKPAGSDNVTPSKTGDGKSNDSGNVTLTVSDITKELIAAGVSAAAAAVIAKKAYEGGADTPEKLQRDPTFKQAVQAASNPTDAKLNDLAAATSTDPMGNPVNGQAAPEVAKPVQADAHVQAAMNAPATMPPNPVPDQHIVDYQNAQAAKAANENAAAKTRRIIGRPNSVRSVPR